MPEALQSTAVAGAEAWPAAFHPAVESWFRATHGQPSEPQRRGWPLIQSGRHTLIAAPTGSGKTLAAFMCAIDALVQSALRGDLTDEIRVLYVSPLKALSNDIEKNLQEPLSGIKRELARLGLPEVEIRSVVRTGDTPASERNQLKKTPPHILVTTPESLYILLTSESGRQALSSVQSVIIDEIHAMIADKRGAHLALSLERLAALVQKPLARIGLSATQKPIETVARFLVGSPPPGGAPIDCAIVDCGHKRKLLLNLDLPASPLDAVMSHEVWGEVYDRLAQLVEQNTTTLVFVGNRRLAERLCRHLGERLGEERVAAHHGSLSKERRLDAEQRLKAGKLKALVATASLELGIDIGAVDLVCQLGSTRSIARLLQRVGRAGHQLGGIPDGKVFPLSRNDLVECSALVDCVQRGELDVIGTQNAPLDILAQQVVAMTACEEWPEDALFERVRRADPYKNLERERFDAVIQMLANGWNTGRGRRSALVRHDAVTRTLQGRKAARLVALTNGGAIPDNADYRVILEPEQTHVGSVGEDFAVESMAGDIFQLGNASWQILKVESGIVRVADARGQPPTIPFWLGEAPARTEELSEGVSRLRSELLSVLDVDPPSAAGLEHAERWLEQERGLPSAAARQLVDYLGAAQRTLGVLPTRRRVVVERFFDAAENMHVIVHSSFGARINRAWGLALRKRFCKTFNFELQAAATEDAFILSLGPTHSFELASIGQFLRSNTARDVLVQALLDSPMFEIRWRHNATRALATPRFQGGKKVPAPLVRIRANDLLATAFPDQQACLENLPGEREIPDHPLVQQTIEDCLREAMDVDGFLGVLRGIESGEIEMVYRDLTEASPLAHEIINANPYAFLDPAPLEERRTQAIITRRFFDPKTSDDLGALDQSAIDRVRAEAWPDYDTTGELAEALYLCGFLCEDEAERGREGHTPARELFDALRAEGRATRFVLSSGTALWVSAERLMQLRAMCPAGRAQPELALPERLAMAVEPEAAWREIIRGRLEMVGPTRVDLLAEPLRAAEAEAPARVYAALLALENEGSAMQGRFTPGSSAPGRSAGAEEWCERGLLARIHRHTLDRLRREIEPVTSAVFMRFLFAWQRVSNEHRQLGRDAVPSALAQLEGFEAAAGTWETALLPSRVADYDPGWLDALCLSGQVRWGRMHAPGAARALRSLISTPIVLARRENWPWIAGAGVCLPDEELSNNARCVLEQMRQLGACFYQDLRGAVATPSELELALSELVAAGRVTADSFSGMRGLLPSAKRKLRPGRRSRARPGAGLESAGRWTLIAPPRADAAGTEAPTPDSDVRAWALLLLRRYGVVFRTLLEREHAPAWRDLLREYRRLEARGEVRGGRFVQRHAGEQFALPEAVPLLRSQRQAPARGDEICLSACDPLNLLGTLLPGERVAAAPHNSILFRDGLPLAVREGGEARFLETLDESEMQRIAARLKRGPGPVPEPVLRALPDARGRRSRAVA